LLANGEEASREVQVGPRQPQQLGSPQTEGQDQYVGRRQAVVSRTPPHRWRWARFFLDQHGRLGGLWAAIILLT
jgi:hypothetical protein